MGFRSRGVPVEAADASIRWPAHGGAQTAGAVSGLLLVVGLLYGAPAEWAQGLSPCNADIPGDAHLILVGRNRAPDAFNEQALLYAETDVRSMYRAAIRFMCFRPDQITVLTGVEATPEGLLAHLEARAPLARLFVYISAHGKRYRDGRPGYQIGLATPLDSQALRRAVEARGARQTFVFLDTCNAGRALAQKGSRRPVLEPQIAPGRFWLAAAEGTTAEDHELRAGAATASVLRIIMRGDRLDANGLCRQLKLNLDFQGACVPTDAPVRIVPGPIEQGTVEVREPGAWAYQAFDGPGGVALTNLKNTARMDARFVHLATGRYTIRRVLRQPYRCERVAVDVRAGAVTVVEDVDWESDGANCARIKSREHVVDRPTWGLWIAGGAGAGWVPSSGVEARVRVGVSRQPQLNRYGAYLFFARTIRPNPDVDPRDRVTSEELGLVLATDPLMMRSGAFDLFAGFEAGAGLTEAERFGPTGLAAVRLGGAWRIDDRVQPELLAQIGVRSFRRIAEEPVVTVPWAGLNLGLTIGLGR